MLCIKHQGPVSCRNVISIFWFTGLVNITVPISVLTDTLSQTCVTVDESINPRLAHPTQHPVPCFCFESMWPAAKPSANSLFRIPSKLISNLFYIPMSHMEVLNKTRLIFSLRHARPGQIHYIRSNLTKTERTCRKNLATWTNYPLFHITV